MSGVELVFDSLSQYLVVSAVIVVAAAVYVALGFGAGLIAVGALALVLTDIQDVVVLLLLIGLPAELLVRRDGTLGVFTVEDGTARFRPVPAAQEGQPVALDLPPGTRIVDEGRERLGDGEAVQTAD